MNKLERLEFKAAETGRDAYGWAFVAAVILYAPSLASVHYLAAVPGVFAAIYAVRSIKPNWVLMRHYIRQIRKARA